MTPTLHPQLVNGRFGDPAVYVELLRRREAILFDLGDLSALSARDLLRVSHAFVSHTHIDHFVGFDALLRISIGREREIALTGPPGFIAKVCHKLGAYEWDLVDRYACDLVFSVAELDLGGGWRTARLRFKSRFAREDGPWIDALPDALGMKVSAVALDHHGPCLGYAVEEPAHANVWKNRLAERGLAPGPWLTRLKEAILTGEPDDLPIELSTGEAPLGSLRDLVSVGRGQKLVYVTDVADTPANRERIAVLAADGDLLLIEARFRAADADQAAARAHLTTRAAGEIARSARVRRVEPFHFSPRYEDEEEMVAEVHRAFVGEPALTIR